MGSPFGGRFWVHFGAKRQAIRAIRVPVSHAEWFVKVSVVVLSCFGFKGFGCFMAV
jgi:hypothetical protein